jgi:hypothetical protein
MPKARIAGTHPINTGMIHGTNGLSLLKAKDVAKAMATRPLLKTLWCDICQRQGHSTDWCYDNPNRSGGKPLYDELWCETCNRSGHTSRSCYATSIKITPKGKGKSKGKPGKSGNRGWKSQNFPAGYHSEQATLALHDETSSTEAQAWWDDCELGSAILEGDPNPVPLHPSLLDDYVELNNFDDSDDDYISDYIDLVLFAIVTTIGRLNA